MSSQPSSSLPTASQLSAVNTDDLEELTPMQLQQVVQAVSNLKNEVQSLASKMGELDIERNEHKSVMDAISKLEQSRKCFRLVGGVLVERTIEEVLPAVTKNHDGISSAITSLSDTLKKKESTLQEILQKYGRFLNGQQTDMQDQQVNTRSESKQNASVLV